MQAIGAELADRNHPPPQCWWFQYYFPTHSYPDPILCLSGKSYAAVCWARLGTIHSAIFCSSIDMHLHSPVKVRFQSPDMYGKYRSTMHAFTTILREENVRGLYKGIASPMVCLLDLYLIKNWTTAALYRPPPLLSTASFSPAIASSCASS